MINFIKTKKPLNISFSKKKKNKKTKTIAIWKNKNLKKHSTVKKYIYLQKNTINENLTFYEENKTPKEKKNKNQQQAYLRTKQKTNPLYFNN